MAERILRDNMPTGERTQALRSMRALIRYEISGGLRSPLFWVAMGLLVMLLLVLKTVFTGGFFVNGRLMEQQFRVMYSLAWSYSALVFISTLYTLCLCLDRLGNDYLRNSDLLTLSRAVGRGYFLMSKIAALFFLSYTFFSAALILFWMVILKYGGANLYSLFLLLFPQTLGILCIVSLYFLFRNWIGNLPVFFAWFLFLPLNYAFNLWHYYGKPFAEDTARAQLQTLLPQFGGLHAFSLGLVQDFFYRENTVHSLLSLTIWTVLSLALGIWAFRRKRL